MEVINFSNLTKEIQKVYNTNKALALAAFKGKDILGTITTPLLDYKVQLMHGTGGMMPVTEDGEFPSITGKQGDSMTYTQEYFGAKIPVTKTVRKFWREKNGTVMTQVKSATDKTYDDIDQAGADALTNGWATSYVDVYGRTVSGVCPDGLCFFNAAHTNAVSDATYSNIIHDGTNPNPTISRDAIIKTRALARKHREPTADGVGVLKPVLLDTIYVSGDLEDEAIRIVESAKLPGSPNNDTNKALKSMKIVVWERLAVDGRGVDRSAYWFLGDSRKVKESIFYIQSQKPVMYSPEEAPENKTWVYKLDGYYTIGRGWAAYLWGSNGTES